LARPLALAYWLALAVGTHWPGLNLGYSLDVVFQLDKILHALAMGVLMLGLAWARPLGSLAAWPAQALAACLIASAYAVLDELSQGWMDRIVSPADAVANLIGVLGAYLVLTARWVRPYPRWAIILARLVWLLIAPGLVLLVTLPVGNDIILAVFRYLGLLGVMQADKTSHFVLAMTLTWLLAVGCPAGRRRQRLSAAVTILVMAASAPIIEVVQRRTGRGFELADVYAHQLGLLAGLTLWSMLSAARSLAAAASHQRASENRWLTLPLPPPLRR
ncbi:MAG TPA: VanZ family protein, partial [Phycisphaeraceae bacterium]